MRVIFCYFPSWKIRRTQFESKLYATTGKRFQDMRSRSVFNRRLLSRLKYTYIEWIHVFSRTLWTAYVSFERCLKIWLHCLCNLSSTVQNNVMLLLLIWTILCGVLCGDKAVFPMHEVGALRQSMYPLVGNISLRHNSFLVGLAYPRIHYRSHYIGRSSWKASVSTYAAADGGS